MSAVRRRLPAPRLGNGNRIHRRAFGDGVEPPQRRYANERNVRVVTDASKARKAPWLLLPSTAAAPLLLLAVPSAAAQDYPTREVGAWTVAANSDATGCFISKTFRVPGDTTILLGLDMDGSNHLSMLNSNWSIKPKAREKLNFRLSSGGYTNDAIGISADGKRGFVTSFEPKFLTYFAQSKAIHVYRGKTPVEKLDLAGSGAAIEELRRCVWIHKSQAKPADRPRSRDAAIPKDPFASTPRSR